ncbi:PREDICTED: N-alpha-acetyltransferase 15, NatA auxiliary subunit [Amphimedon queenslandica]|uniref:N-alpha-acetyltransferase 15, NatA auxiliary subunit n=1 Tax=Amphimedon queenslandica TaxID=400682 RepID=A0A1X7UH32_AMPQE|nr:PREDICTED: N-alpha-acetyltransferase 15, NatA auxiliary subunit [Amphimedon queenslandica]|eukprot:XP_019854443.1 PREDICTED: N-alpha-acetyltransferase 15, NatA auxiliary subunit [Amphimedon queenslandica]
MAANSQKLPQKESGIFKKVVRSYECKQYKNGLKFAKQILSNPKHSDHGETLAMKGLILNCIGKKDDAYDCVRRGLKNDLTSHVCWHVYGLLQRSDKKYDEAIKAYRNALKHDKENVQILRDLSLLQVQMRDMDGFCDTRYQLLKVRPAQRSSWVGYALAYHMNNDFEMALKVMGEYRKTQAPPQKLPDYEFSEMILYEVQLLMESGAYKDALKFLEDFRHYVSDMLAYAEIKGDILLRDKRFEEAELIFHDLIHRNPENLMYYQKLEECLNITSDENRMELYRVLKEEFPRSHVCRKVPLGFLKGPAFRDMIDQYLRPPLHKGVPSLWIGLKALYENKEKAQVIEELVLLYEKNLQSCNKFHPEDPDPMEPPSAILWVWFFLAQHFDRCGDHRRALEYIDKSIDHTPTHIELYMLKSKIYKHAGDLEEAALWMDEARSMDTADRFVNCKCVKYLLRVNKIDRAIETAGLFTREGMPPLQTMDDMQCMWFQKELARAYWRSGQYGEALVKYHEIDKHFDDIIEDQFDFHTYCMRKMTLRPYVGVLRLEDRIRGHRFYFDSAHDIIELYLYLYDNPDAKRAKDAPIAEEIEQDLSHLSESERRKIKRKQRKALAKAKEKAAEQEKEKEKENKPRHDDDRKAATDENKIKFNPKELLNVEDPLNEANKFLKPLQSMCTGNIRTHLLAYAIHSRRRKYLLMLQSLKRAFSCDPENPTLHCYIVDYVLTLEKERPELPDPVHTVIDDCIPRLTDGGKSPDELNQSFIAKHSNSLEHLVAAAQVLYKLHPDYRTKAIAMVTNLSDSLIDRSLRTCRNVHKFLSSGFLGDCSDELASYSSQCHALFPFASSFKPPVEAGKELESSPASPGDAPPCVGVAGRSPAAQKES